jgi:hypothetical protein
MAHRLLRTSRAACVALVASCGGGEGGRERAALLPYFTGDGVALFDPRQPVSDTNPVHVDAPLVKTAAILLDAEAAGGELHDLRPARAVLLRDDRLFGMSLLDGISHTPVRISNAADICNIKRLFADYRTVTDSWVMVELRVDGQCFGDAASYAIVKADAPPSADPVPVPTRDIQALHAANGAVAGFLSYEPPNLIRRNADFADPVAVLALAAPGPDDAAFSRIDGDYTDTVYFVTRASGASTSTLYRYRVGSGTLTPIVAHAESSFPEFYSPGTVDDDAYYFENGAAIYRLAHASTAPMRMSAAAFAPSFADRPVLTDARVVFGGYFDDGYDIYSLPKAAIDTQPDELVVVQADSAYVYATHPAGTVLVNTQGGSSWVAQDDGTDSVEQAASQWRGVVLEGPSGRPSRLATPARALRVEGGDLSIYDGASGAKLLDLGPSPETAASPGYPAFWVGFGRYLSFDAAIDRGGAADLDAYVIDTVSGTQPLPVLTTPGLDEGAMLSNRSHF